ncbi:MAG TPA: hypothetical protein VI316_00605 [Candidatus Dormibacteraeota bacterium]
MTPAVASLALCGLAGVAATAHAGDAWRTVVLLGLIAVAVQATGLRSRRFAAVVVSGALLIAAYAMGSAGATDAVDPLAPAYGVCLLLMAELGFLALSIPMGLSGDPQARRRYLRSVTVVVLASLAFGEALVVAAGAIGSGAQLMLLAGAAAAVAIAGTLERLALASLRDFPAAEQ